FQAEDGIRDFHVTGVQTCALPILDAAHSERASVFGWQGGSLPALFLATSHPERVQRLVLFHGCARIMWAPDHPWGMTSEQERERSEERRVGKECRDRWGRVGSKE